MPSLISRQSGRQSGGTQTQRSNDLPDYEAPAYPLTSKGRIELNGLLNRHPLEKLEKNIEDAISILTENVGAVNDNYHANLEYLKQRKTRLSKLEETNADKERITSERAAVEELEGSISAQKEEVDRMTITMEENVRKMIDTQSHLNHTKETLSDLARTNASTFQSSHRAAEDEGPSTFDPTDPTNSTPSATSHIQSFRDTLSSKRARYATYTPQQRYANNNSYRQFYKLRHDAQHPDGSVPVPHQDSWFTAPHARPGETGAPSTAADEDDDIAVAQERISTRCQITMREYSDPVTSRKCPHSFERSAILELIDHSTLRVVPQTSSSQRTTLPPAPEAGEEVEVIDIADDPTITRGGRGGRGGRPATQHAGGEHAVRCPLPGCEKILRKEDLYTDAILVRRIKRQQAAERAAEGEEEGREAVEVGSSDAEIDDEEEIRTGTARGRRVKGERRAGSVEL
ncbi:Hypothetical protein D9617_4g000380 [Elsinoe fawcettii]|nr:Hypothetical protein D9617_4g000380 [Elsinoe fawcettii]